MSENMHEQQKDNQLSPAKRAIMEKWRQGRMAPPSTQIDIPRRPETEPAPLSYAQEYIWSLLQRYPDLSIFHFPLGEVVLYGPLQRQALFQSIDAIVQRHAIFRTVFLTKQGETFQQAATQGMHPQMIYVPLEQLSEEKKDEDIENILVQEVLQPFNVSQGPHLRVILIQRQVDEHILVIITHRMVADGWSRGVFYRELNALYKAYVEGSQPILPPLPFQYSDFAAWQRRILQQPEFQVHANYWLQRLQAAPSLLLPTDVHQQSVQNGLADHYSFALPESLAHALRLRSQQEGVTLFVFLFATFNLLLHSQTHQDDLVILTPISNRRQYGSEHLIGSFVNNLVLRTDMTHIASFADLLRLVHRNILDAYAHHSTPYELIAESLPNPLQANELPFARCLFIVHDVPLPQFNLLNLAGQRFNLTHETLIQDMVITIITLENTITGYIRYKRELFRRDTIQTLSERWQELLSNIVTTPQSKGS